ncbi:MAG: aminotransferase class I/II-fold pyridoxal phosphate-dependent enzyme [Nitrososphaerota archaeon]
MSKMSSEDIRKLREEIKEVTSKILELIAYRLKKAEEIGKLKNEIGISYIDHEVEKELRELINKKSLQLGLDTNFTQQLMTLIFKESIKQQMSLTKFTNKTQITHMDIFRKAKELEAEGKKIIHLEVGEPYFGAPREVSEKLSEAAKKGYAFYGEPLGRTELRFAIAECLEKRFSISLKKDEILITPGGRFAVFLAAATTLSPGDEAIIIDPSWPMYKQVTEFLQSRPVIVETRLEDGWIPNIEELERAASHATKLLFINYPNNPTGVTIDRKRLEEILDFARRRNLYVVSDEVYMDYSFVDFTSILEIGYENAIMLMSFSKNYGMTGYRIGYMVAKREIIERAAKIQALLMTCVPEFIQMAALEALKDRETPKKYCEEIKKRIEVVCQKLDSMNAEYVKPTGGMYVFPRFKFMKRDSSELALKLLEKYGVSIAPGSVFGNYPNYFRISVGIRLDQIVEGIERLNKAINE